MKFRWVSAVALGGFLSAAGLGTIGAAQPSYPTHTVSIVVPFPAGGTTDVLMRMLGQIVSKEWNQPIIVDNRSGATGAIAGEYVVRQPADGHTLLIATPTSHTALRSLRRDLPYDPMKDLIPVTLLNINPNIMVVNPDKVPVHTVAELIEYLKAHPGKLSYSSTGIGSAANLSVELFKIMTGTDMVHVPYRGNAPALNDLLAGNVDLTIDSMTSVGPQVKQGKLRALAAATTKRSRFAPDLPTIAETVPGFSAETWNGIVVRAGTGPEIVDKISRDFDAALRQPQIEQRMTDLLSETVGNSPAEFQKFLEADQARWERVVSQINITTGQK